MLCEAYVDILNNKLSIRIDRILDQDNYNELLKINRIPKNFTDKILIKQALFEPIIMYEANELYFGAFLKVNKYKKDEPKLEKFYFIKKAFDNKKIVPFKSLPNQEKKYIEEQLEKKEYKDKLNKLITNFQNSKKSVDTANALHEKELDDFKRTNKDLIKIINSYYQNDELKTKYEFFDYSEFNYEKDYIDDLKIIIKGLSDEDKKLLKEVIASDTDIINRLNNVQTYLTNLKKSKGQKISNSIGSFIAVTMVIVIAIVCIFSILTNNDDVEPNYKQGWCSSYTNSYEKCHYSIWENRCVCERR